MLNVGGPAFCALSDKDVLCTVQHLCGTSLAPRRTWAGMHHLRAEGLAPGGELQGRIHNVQVACEVQGRLGICSLEIGRG